MYMAFKSGVSLGGVSAADEDVLSWDGAAYSLVFDDSDVGLDALEIDVLDVLSSDQLLLSFTTSGSVPDVGNVDDSDIVLFGGSLGPATSGTFSMYFDGSNVGLTRNGEDISRFSGSFGSSTSGSFSVHLDGSDLSSVGALSSAGAAGADEDVFHFAGSFGTQTSGTLTLVVRARTMTQPRW